MVRNGKQLIRIGRSREGNGYKLVGEDSKGPVECTQVVSDEGMGLSYDYERKIVDRRMEQVYHGDFPETPESVQSCYLVNKRGHLGKEAVIPLRNSLVPQCSFVMWLVAIDQKTGIPFQ